MPELPEVEVIRRDLEKEAEGKKIKAVEVNSMRVVRRHPNKKHFVKLLEDRKIRTVSRKGKYLLLRLDDENTMVIHLGMSGQLLKEKSAKAPMEPHTHVVITFTQGGQLRYVDPRQFGELFVAPKDELNEIAELAHLGIDPVEEPLSWQLFASLLAQRKAKLKSVLMDQKFVAGIGNIYSDEILFAAGLRYDRQSDELASQEVRRLYRSLLEILHEAIKYRGTSAADEQFRDLYGELGGYQEFLKVYQHTNEPCRRCRTPIVRAKFSQRSTWYCPQCQT
ncbi:MAG: formamidopyrimidine-DNA glycosylase [Acidobacteria bacterium]|nr:MAG: formamidopyrimidine-DNA glycosylase [Acidobacteriota bacterium]